MNVAQRRLTFTGSVIWGMTWLADFSELSGSEDVEFPNE